MKNVAFLLLIFLCNSLLAQLPVDNDGWTIIPDPSPDSKVIYVSSSEGNDNNSGLSPESPVASIQKAKQLTRNGYPDYMLLKRGDEWWPDKGLGTYYSGKDALHPTVISHYGKSGARPKVNITGHFIHVFDKEVSHLIVNGIEFYAYKHDPNSPDYESESKVSAISYIQARGENLLIEDCKFNYCQMGSYTAKEKGALKNFKFRRNIIIHSWAGESYIIHELRTRVQGMYISGIEGVLIEENLFDHNGWNEQIKNAGPTMYNHNIYMSTHNPDASKILVRGNILARASAHGLQLRSGGTVEENLFVQNAINLNIGYHAGSPLPGAFGIARNNVFQEARLMDSLNKDYPRTGAVRGIGEITIPAVIENNIFSHCLNEAQFAVDTYNDKWGFGGVLEKNNNISYKWTTHTEAPNPDWPDPERTIADYHKSLGKKASTIAFLLEARKRPINTWWPEYSAYAVNTYIREGFN